MSATKKESLLALTAGLLANPGDEQVRGALADALTEADGQSVREALAMLAGALLEQRSRAVVLPMTPTPVHEEVEGVAFTTLAMNEEGGRRAPLWDRIEIGALHPFDNK